MEKQRFLELAKKYNVVPLVHDAIFDLDNPVSIFIKAGGYKLDYSFLLESVTGGSSRGRYSILGLKSHGIVKGKGGNFTYTNTSGDIQALKSDNAIFALEEITKQLKLYEDPTITGFVAGAVGFFSYDIIHYYENIVEGEENPDPLDVPDMVYTLPEQVVWFDHLRGSIKIIQNVFLDSAQASEEAYAEAMQSIDQLEDLIKSNKKLSEFQKLERPTHNKFYNQAQDDFNFSEWSSNTTDEEYADIVRKAKDYIVAGDIFQVVLSKRFHRQFDYNPFFLYRALRVTNPSPYMFYLNFPEAQIIGSSPEILVQKEKDKVLVRPIAGTIQRGMNETEDEKHAESLLSDEKEIAEHVMLVDLGRNDVGRISEPGSVKVTEFKTIEKYSHVMHIVSNVIGKVNSKMTSYDALRATFPAGTVSGAPKVRAMQIIEELEKEKRGIYSGCIGYFSLNGNMDSAIALRTMLVKGKRVYIQAGAGLVYDSDSTKENTECFKKASAIFKAVDLFLNGGLAT